MWCCASPPTQQPSIHSFLPACLLPCFSGRRKKRTGTKASAFVSYQVFLMGGIKRVKIVSLTDHQACQKMDFTYLKGGPMKVFDRELTKCAVLRISILLLLSKWNFFKHVLFRYVLKNFAIKSLAYKSLVFKSLIQSSVGRFAWLHISCKILLIFQYLAVLE